MPCKDNAESDTAIQQSVTIFYFGELCSLNLLKVFANLLSKYEAITAQTQSITIMITYKPHRFR